LLGAEEHTQISLTESLAMYPAAAVSGFYFSHPDSKYFGLGQIGQDQVKEYASKTKTSIAEAEKLLMPSLHYKS